MHRFSSKSRIWPCLSVIGIKEDRNVQDEFVLVYINFTVCLEEQDIKELKGDVKTMEKQIIINQEEMGKFFIAVTDLTKEQTVSKREAEQRHDQDKKDMQQQRAQDKEDMQRMIGEMNTDRKQDKEHMLTLMKQQQVSLIIPIKH